MVRHRDGAALTKRQTMVQASQPQRGVVVSQPPLNPLLGKQAKRLCVLLSLVLLAGCRPTDAPATTTSSPALSFQPPATWQPVTEPGLAWAAVPPAGDPLAGHARLCFSEMTLADATPPTGQLQVAALVEGRNTTLPSGAYQTVKHRTAKYGAFGGLETEAELVGAGGSRRIRQFFCWQAGKQYTLTLTADETGYDAASQSFAQVIEVAAP